MGDSKFITTKNNSLSRPNILQNRTGYYGKPRDKFAWFKFKTDNIPVPYWDNSTTYQLVIDYSNEWFI